MSWSCWRVASPAPGRSTLITSAPNQARSWVQVGPDCTCVKSRIFTPSRALPAWPHGLVEGCGRPFPFAFSASFCDLTFTTYFVLACGLTLTLLWACTFLRVAIVWFL